MAPEQLPPSTRITAEEAHRLQAESMNIGRDMLMWTVFENPSDHPGKFIARPIEIRQFQKLAVHLEADTLLGIWQQLPPGLFRLNRNVEDDPVIVETWF